VTVTVRATPSLDPETTQAAILDPTPSERAGRGIMRRIVVRGDLMLDTPTLLGNGDADGPTDMAVLRDSIGDALLLTGATLAGALRHYLRVREHGYYHKEVEEDLTETLFGGQSGDDEGEQSLLIVDDARGDAHPVLELRDGVRIDPASRTAADGGKYDLELLAAGTTFPLLFELLIPAKRRSGQRDVGAPQQPQQEWGIEDNDQMLKHALATALCGLSGTTEHPADIGMGRGKSRGFGRCHVAEWRVWEFDLTRADDRLAWLKFDPYDPYQPADQNSSFARHRANSPVRRDLPGGWPDKAEPTRRGPVIADVLGVDKALPDERDVLRVRASFQLNGTLLIRAGQDETGAVPDVAHLRSRRLDRNGVASKLPVISGTSLAGVLRHRATRIVHTLGLAPTLVEDMFGFARAKGGARDAGETGGEAQASRLVVHESVVRKHEVEGKTTEEVVMELVQQRVSIDRFTAGSYPGALFAEGVLAGADAAVILGIELRNPERHEIGLVLLLLKDLWTGDLPVGGESSIGRGRLRGYDAAVTWKERTWTIKDKGGRLVVDKPEELNGFVAELTKRRVEG